MCNIAYRYCIDIDIPDNHTEILRMIPFDYLGTQMQGQKKLDNPLEG